MTRIERVTSPLPRECSTTEPHGQILYCALPRPPATTGGPAACDDLVGAGEGNRTLVVSLEGFCSTIELHPPTSTSTALHCSRTTKAAQQRTPPLRQRTRPAQQLTPSTAQAYGGGDWIRTNVGARPTDLQSAPFNHSGTPPPGNERL